MFLDRQNRNKGTKTGKMGPKQQNEGTKKGTIKKRNRGTFAQTATKLPFSVLLNGRNTVSRVLFRKRELTEFCGKLAELCENSVSSLRHINNKLGGAQ